MQTIQIEIPDDLALKLLPYRDELSSLLEAGLAIKQLTPLLDPNETEAERVRRIFAASGRVRMPMHYPGKLPYVRHTPVPITGQPVSEIIIAQRGER